MKKYTVLLNGEYFTKVITNKINELDILEKLFNDNQLDFEYIDIDSNGKAYIKAWQGIYTIK
jgi:hypothetical protein